MNPSHTMGFTFIGMYCVDPTVDEPIMLLDKHIGQDDEDGPGILGDLFQRELLQLDGMGKKRIQVWINSPGGSVIDGYAIYNAILRSETPVDTYCCGMAASIAGVIFQAGRKRYIADYGVLMYHNPFGGSEGALDAMRESIITMVSAKSGMDRSATELMMNRETFVEAGEAVKMGLADVVEQSAGLNRKWVRTADVKSNWKEYAKVLNSIINKNYTMKNIANKLKLSEEASEAAIVAEITNMENSFTALKAKNEADLEKAKSDLDAAKATYDTLKADHDAKIAELSEANNKLAVAADEAATAKATALVQDAVKIGKIKSEASAAWIASAKADFDAAKALLDGIQSNVKAVKFDITDKKGTDPAKTETHGVAVDMILIENRLNGQK